MPGTSQVYLPPLPCVRPSRYSKAASTSSTLRPGALRKSQPPRMYRWPVSEHCPAVVRTGCDATSQHKTPIDAPAAQLPFARELMYAALHSKRMGQWSAASGQGPHGLANQRPYQEHGRDNGALLLVRGGGPTSIFCISTLKWSPWMRGWFSECMISTLPGVQPPFSYVITH